MLSRSPNCGLCSKLFMFHTSWSRYIRLLKMILTDTNLNLLSHLLMAIIGQVSWVLFKLIPWHGTFRPFCYLLLSDRRLSLNPCYLDITLAHINPPICITIIFYLKIYVTSIIFLSMLIHFLGWWLFYLLFLPRSRDLWWVLEPSFHLLQLDWIVVKIYYVCGDAILIIQTFWLVSILMDWVLI